jgi:Negative regulator of beta-lactamase expression
MKQNIKSKLSLLIVLTLAMVAAPRAQETSNNYLPAITSMDALANEQIRQDYDSIKKHFDEAYRQYPNIPRGVLEAVSFTYTRFHPFVPSDTLELDKNALPPLYSVMGLTLYGKGVFRENLKLVSQLSGHSANDISNDCHIAILAYAAAFSRLQASYRPSGDEMMDILPILLELSELPLHDKTPREIWETGLPNIDLETHMELFPMMSSLYAICLFLNNGATVIDGFPKRNINFEKIFGKNLLILRHDTVSITPQSKHSYTTAVTDYPLAIHCPAATCNYTQGRTQTISNITIHYTQGTYAGSIAWFQNCNAQASAHYVIRSIDGQVTQMVAESDKAWHVGVANGYTIGIEHEAYGNIHSFFTSAMYLSSANLVRNICTRRTNIRTFRTFYRDTLDDGSVLNAGLHNLGGATACTQIRGHQHFPSQSHTDPGPYWDWNYYYKLLNPATITDIRTDDDGLFTDLGGIANDYGNDQRQLTLIHVPDADSIALNFTSFELEPDYDFLWIYEGDSPFGTLLGRWNTQSPGRVVAQGGDLLVEFRSDCSDTRPGWIANWHAYKPSPALADNEPPQTEILHNEDDWVTHDFTLSFRDTDNLALQHRFYQIIEQNDAQWTGNTSRGFLCDNFDVSLDTTVWSHDGSWLLVEHALRQPSIALSQTNIAASLAQVNDAVLFDFYLSILSGDSCWFYFGTNGLSANTTTSCGHKILWDKARHEITLFEVHHGLATLIARNSQVYFTHGQSYLYRVVWDRNHGNIQVYRHGTHLLEATGSVTTSGTNVQVGFSTNHASVSIDNVRSYVARGNEVTLTVGAHATRHLRTQAVHGSPTTKVKSIVLDSAGMFSPLVEKSIRVDYTPPIPVHPKIQLNLDRLFWPATISVTWPPSEDEHSGINDYHYILNLQGNPSRTNWESAGLQNSLLITLETAHPCAARVGVKAENGAGLFSPVTFTEWDKTSPRQTRTNPATDLADDLAGQRVELYDSSGRLLSVTDTDAQGKARTDDMPAGLYFVRIIPVHGKPHVVKIYKH